MAETYTVNSQNTLFAANKCMISLFNETGSGRVVRVYRIWALNNQTTAVIGVLTNMEIRRLSAASGGTTLSPATHDTTNALSTTGIVAATNASITPTDIFRRIIWSTDEPAANATLSLDELECLIPVGNIWAVGYGDTTSTPITLRENEGIGIVNTGASVGQIDISIEYTVSNS